MVKKGIVFLSFLLLSACVTSQPDTVEQRYAEAQLNLKKIFSQQHNLPRDLDFYEALARGLKYNLDYRIKLANTALQTGQLELAEFAMFPVLNATGSLYTRSNDLATTGITTSGALTDVLISTPRTLRSARIAMSWNILDFGMAYVRAKQQGERVLIAQEESRKQLQLLAQDILVAYWNAYSIQELINNTYEFERELLKAKQKLENAMLDKTIPKEGILQFEEAVLNGNRQMIQLKNKYDKAMITLKRLLNLPLDQHYILARPPTALIKTQNLAAVDFRKLDAISLVNRPELRGQQYQIRIAKHGVLATIFQALPGITLNYGWNYNSNQFLVNNKWIDRSIDASWNLLNLATLPSSLKTANTQIEYEKLKSMALTLTVLTETRSAYYNCQNLSEEYAIIQQQVANANAIYTLTHHRQHASLASDQQVILSKIHWITVKMDENLVLADMSTAVGQLYLSAGFDVLPLDINNLPLPRITKIIRTHFESQSDMDFKQYVDLTYQRLFNVNRKKVC